MLPQDTCPAPPPPPGAPPDWIGTVDPNCFLNIQRLAQWTGGPNPVPSGTSPETSFEAVAPGSLGGGNTPPAIYVVTHGWAPGYRAVVNQYGGKLLWWSDDAAVQNVWASSWAWSPVLFDSQFPINSNGFLPSIAALDPGAIILAYSWIDNSATDSGYLDLTEVYRSEAHTHLNGRRLANALQQAIAGSFWTAGGVLRLIGHSHGSKVATVAALTLQQLGLPVAQLTILDAPDSEAPLTTNGGNLLGFYLEQMNIMHPFFLCASGAFIDNYASYFGVGYDGAANLKNIVEVALDPDELYWKPWDVSDRHTYAAAWYGGAAAGAAAQQEPPLGLAWPPPPQSYLPALQQNWPGGKTQASQWSLALGKMLEVCSYGTQPVSVATVAVEGNVKVDSSGNITFGPAGTWPEYSIFQGSYQNKKDSDNWGIAFDLLWTNPMPGDYFVVAMETDLGLETLFVLEGQSLGGGEACSQARTSPAINCDASGSSLSISIYFLAAQGNLSGQVELSNFRFVVVDTASGYLRSCRLAAAAERLAQRKATAPQTARGLAMARSASPPL